MRKRWWTTSPPLRLPRWILPRTYLRHVPRASQGGCAQPPDDNARRPPEQCSMKLPAGCSTPCPVSLGRYSSPPHVVYGSESPTPGPLPRATSKLPTAWCRTRQPGATVSESLSASRGAKSQRVLTLSSWLWHRSFPATCYPSPCARQPATSSLRWLSPTRTRSFWSRLRCGYVCGCSAC